MDPFDEWVIAEGNDIAAEIHANIKKTSSSLVVEDGNHAVWHKGSLGILLVLPYEHAMAFNHEAIQGDYDNCPVHSYVFETITEMIMRATSLLGNLEDED
tara:strand:- start:28864 stop:29163 length:300 start_codon:yes stop_codon:yes gene_type:complete